MTHFTYRERTGSGSRITNDCHLYYVEQCRAWFGIYHPASIPHKNMRKNGLNNRHGDFCESGIRAGPESVGVGKFCRLRLRLRLREKQPTPTDSDSGSDSDSAALLVRDFAYSKHPLQRWWSNLLSGTFSTPKTHMGSSLLFIEISLSSAGFLSEPPVAELTVPCSGHAQRLFFATFILMSTAQ